MLGLCVCVHIQARRLGGFRGFGQTAHIAAAGPWDAKSTKSDNAQLQFHLPYHDRKDPLGFMCALLWIYLLRIMNPPPPTPEYGLDIHSERSVRSSVTESIEKDGLKQGT